MSGSSPLVDHFPDPHELKRFAINFIRTRLESMKKDVDHCLSGKLAPFPAVLYCLSTLDLLGALYSGQAKKRDPVTHKSVDTKTNSKKYMIELMNYTEEQATLIIEIFRHKLVHLAQPNPVFSYNGRTISWVYYHANPEKHLLLEDFPPGTAFIVKSDWKITVNQCFNISISQLVQDIVNSVENHGGLLDKLENDSIVVQTHVKKAIEEIYDPNP